MPTNGTYVERLLNYKQIRQATHLQYDEKKQIIACHAKAWQCLSRPSTASSNKPSSKYRSLSPYPLQTTKKTPTRHPDSKLKTSFSAGTKSPPITKPPKLSYAAAAIQQPKRKISHANAGSTTVRQRRIVYCGQAVAISHPMEQPTKDGLSKEIPAFYDNQVIDNPKAQTAIYEQMVLLNSGASDCMCPARRYLTFIRTTFAAVCLADGTLHAVDLSRPHAYFGHQH